MAGSGAVQFPEIRGEPEGAMDLKSAKPAKPDVTNRSKSTRGAVSTSALPVTASANIAPTPGVALTFKGLNHRDDKYYNDAYVKANQRCTSM